MNRLALGVALVLATVSCNHVRPAAAPIGAAAELTQLSNSGARAIYVATYRYSTVGPLAPGVATRMQIVQHPPTSIRKLETSTPGGDGRPVTVRTWQATDTGGSYSCTEYSSLGIRCVPNALPPATFHSAQLDELFDAPRRDGYFGNVARAAARARIAGHIATCFEGVPVAGQEAVRYELCYTSDGILLRARRTVSGSVPSGVDARREAVVEAVTISRDVKPSDLQLPGPITDPRDLHQ